MESEVAEFVDGKATLKYPGQTLIGLIWQHHDLGAVSVSGSVATATVVDGYSLAAVSYSVVTVDWLVTLTQRAEAVQFLLVEA